MGGGFSSARSLSSFLQTLEKEECASTHPIWNSISPSEVCSISFNYKVLLPILDLQKKRPRNYAQLIRFSSEIFTKGVQNDIKNMEKYCDLVLNLLIISQAPKETNPWFKPPDKYTTSATPLSAVVNTLQRVLGFGDSSQASLEQKLIALKTLALIQNISALGKPPSKDPSKYLLFFESFNSMPCIQTAFDYIIKTKNVLYLNALLTFCCPCLHACNAWIKSLNAIEPELLNKAFSVLLQNQSMKDIQSLLDKADTLVTLFFITLNKSKSFFTFIEANDLCLPYLTAILVLFQHRFEDSTVTYFHSILLMILSRFTSSYTTLLALNQPFNLKLFTKFRPRKGTYADLLIEVLTNPFFVDFEKSFPLIPLFTNILKNISSTTTTLSTYSASRITKLFAMLCAQKLDESEIIQGFLISLFQFIKFHLFGNLNVLLCTASINKLVMRLTKAKDAGIKEEATKLAMILKATEPALKTTDENERKRLLADTTKNIFSEFGGPPVALALIELQPETEVIWFDWFRALFWHSFPNESQKFNLRFGSVVSKEEKPKKEEPKLENLDHFLDDKKVEEFGNGDELDNFLDDI